jgi:hypothetical protein
MRTQSVDPHVRRYDSPEETPCPNCRTWMLPLERYEIQKSSESPSVEAEWWEIVVFGWSVLVYNYIYDLFTYEGRKRKMAQLKRDVLPQFPGSLVCPRCLHVVKRP